MIGCILVAVTMTAPRAIAIGILCAVSILAQSGSTDLSGVWKRNAEKSKPSGRGPLEMWVKIDQDGSEIRMAMRVRSASGMENSDYTFRPGPEENKNKMHGAPMTSRTRWENGELLIDSVATFGPKEDLRLNERWTLSADGQTLSFVEKHQFATEPAAEDLYVFDRMTPAAWQQEEKPKLAEEAFKNIQVLKGLPAARVMPVMQSFARGLGVECAYCHVPNEFDKDDLGPKRTARNMIKMTRSINDDRFGGANAVTCWTCHRGSTKPLITAP